MKIFPHPIQITLSSTGSYESVDLSSVIGGTSEGVILRVHNTHNSGPRNFAFRETGSTKDIYQDIRFSSLSTVVCSTIDSQTIEFKRETTDVKLYVEGYFTSNDSVFDKDGVDYSTATTGSWTTIDLSADVPSGAKFAIMEFYNSSNSNTADISYRAKGSAFAIVPGFQNTHHGFIIPLDANREFELYISATSNKIHYLGYLTEGSFGTTVWQNDPTATNTYELADSTLDPNYTSSAIAALVYVYQTGSSGATYMARYPTWNSVVDTANVRIFSGIHVVPLDANGKYEIFKGNTTVHFYTFGYLTEQDDAEETGDGDDIYFFKNPIDVSPSTLSSWEAQDMSSFVPADAKMGIYDIHNIASTDQVAGIRPNGEGDQDIKEETLLNATRKMYIPFVSNRIVDTYRADDETHIFLIGYITSDIAEGEDFVDLTSQLSGSGSWQTVDVSASATAGAQWAFMVAVGSTDAINIGVRYKGSSDDSAIRGTFTRIDGFLAPLDGNREFEFYRGTTGVSIYYVGALDNGTLKTSGVSSYTNTAINTLEEFDFTSESPPSDDIVCAIISPLSSTGTPYKSTLKHKDRDWQWYIKTSTWGGPELVKMDSSDIIEAMSENIADVSFKLYGFTGGGAGAPPVGSTGDADLTIPTLISSGRDETLDIDVVLPMVDLEAQAWGVQQTLPIIQLAAGGFWTDAAQMTLPKLTLVATGSQDAAFGSGTLPSLTLEITGSSGEVGATLMTLPSLVVSATGQNLSSANLTLPLLTISNVISEGIAGTATLNLPIMQTSFVGLTGNIATATIQLPLSLTGEIELGRVGTFAKDLVALTITANGFTQTIIVSSLQLPLLLLQATGIANLDAGFSDGSFSYSGTMLSVNLRNNAITRYDNFGFNSFASFGGAHLGANENGIFTLTGSDDAGTDIDKSFKTGITDLGSPLLKRVTDAYLGMTPNGGYVLKVSLDGGSFVSYSITDTGNNIHNVKRNLGKGVKGRYVQAILENVTNSPLNLESLELLVKPINRRR